MPSRKHFFTCAGTLALGICIGCDQSTEAGPVVQMPAAAVLSIPRSAEIFAPGVISDTRWQWRITFTPDGKTA